MGIGCVVWAEALTRPLPRTPDAFGNETSRVERGEAGIGQADGASAEPLTAHLLEFDLYGARCRIARPAVGQQVDGFGSTWRPVCGHWFVVVMHKDGYSPAYSRRQDGLKAVRARLTSPWTVRRAG